MNSVRANKPIAAALALLVLGIVLYNLRWAVHNYSLFKTSDDSGVFLYMGQQIDRGARLYHDLWDSKPPLTYYANALGFLVTHSAAGVFLLCALVGAAFWLFLWRALWRISPTIWAVLAMVLCFGAIWDLRIVPNSVEIFTMTLQAFCVWLLVLEVLDCPRRYSAAAQGFCAALLLSARFNQVGIAVIWILYCLLEPRFSWRERGRRLAGTALGGLAGLLVMYLPLAWSGTLNEGIHGFLLDGIRYASSSGHSRLDCLEAGLFMLSFSPITWLSTAGVLFLAWTAIRGKMRYARLALIAVAWTVVETAMTMVSGYVWAHYFLPMLAPMAMLVAVAGAELDFQTQGWLEKIRDPNLFRRLGTLVTFAAVVTLVGFGCYDLVMLELAPEEVDPALHLARNLSTPGEAVLTWGDMSRGFWFDFGHPPGAALFHCTGFPNRTMYLALGERVLDDLTSHPPPLIVEKSSVLPLLDDPNPNVTFAKPFPPSTFEGWDDPQMTVKKQNLKRYYREAGRDGPYVVWRLRTPL